MSVFIKRREIVTFCSGFNVNIIADFMHNANVRLVRIAQFYGNLQFSPFWRPMYHFTRKIVVTTTILLIFSFGIGTAQNEEQSQTIYVDLEEFQIESDSIDSFIESVARRLAEDNVVLSLTDTSQHRIVITAQYADIIHIGSTEPRTIHDSTLLVTHYDVHFAINNYPTDSAVDTFSAYVHYVLGNYEETINYLNGIEEPRSWGIEFYLANSHLALGNYDIAIEHYLAILEREENSRLRVLYNLSWAYIQTGDSQQAFEYLAYIGEMPTSPRVNSRIAQLYALGFDYDNAIMVINEGIEAAEEFEYDNTTLAELYTVRGQIIFLIYEWDRVEADFNTAIELDPTYAPAYFQRGILFYTMARRDDALADFETYLHIAPTGTEAQSAQQYIDSLQIELEALGGS
ncbi:MAG: tetratricopeptide repeat protein [Anaerolineae bacterium]